MVGLLFCDVGPMRRERKFRAGTQSDIDDYSDKELCVCYRFRWELILFITNLVAGDISRNTWRNHALPPLLQVLITLRFYANGSFLQVISDTFGVDKSTVSRAITDVSRALIAKQHRFIKWPLTNDECVIGCVDGTHVWLQAPSKHESNYVNRKGFHSINVQGVCNHEGE